MNRHGERQVAALQSIEDPINAYIVQHIDPEDDYLYRLYRATNIHTIHGRMASGHIQGRLLKMLVTMIRPRNILEVGTFSGYSAICMAEGLTGDGKVYTFEINDEMEDFTRPWIEQSHVSERIVFAIGDANLLAPKLGITFDMAFIDGDKRTYIETYEMAMSVLRRGGYIVADNTLWDGHVVDSAYDHDQQTLGIRAFNDHVMADKRVEKVILPLRDGLSLIRKVAE
ncbi:O-methyltransferase [Segatella maculosa]|uniref:O-methyltransferase n=1 Tax=Segatella maculosa TaxID=439703 RepID=UPI00035C3E07|nr:O-methyltransferase [Segatella maculosa]